MKKGRIILSVAVVLAAVGSAFALKATKVAQSNLYTFSGGAYHVIQCTSVPNTLGPCASQANTVYTRTTGTYKVFTGERYIAPSL